MILLSEKTWRFKSYHNNKRMPCLLAKRWLRINAIEAASTINSPETETMSSLKCSESRYRHLGYGNSRIGAWKKHLTKNIRKLFQTLAHDRCKSQSKYAIEALSHLKMG
jgi:hypothetical protein